MPPNNEIHSLLLSLITDIQEVTMLWQIGVLLLSLGLAWLAQRLLAERISSQVNADNTPVISARNFNRLMTPISALVLVALGRWMLNHWHPTHLLNIVIPLLFALALVRVTIFILRRVFHDQQWLHPWERTLGWIAWTIVALHIIGILPGILDMLDAMAFYVGQHRLSVMLILQGILALTASLLLALWLSN